MATPFEMIKDFSVAMGHPVATMCPVLHSVPPLDVEFKAWLELRKKLIYEEVGEFIDAIVLGHDEDILKEACDIDYVVKGTLVGIHGMVDPDKGPFEEVHKSNMSKLGDDGKPIFRADGKVMKGPNYRPPNMEQFFE